MKLNKLLTTVLLSGGLLSSAVYAAQSGTISFSGNIAAPACTTLVGAATGTSGGTASLSASITLNNAAPADFSVVGSYVNKTPFNIQLTGCTRGTATTVFAKFGGTAHEDDPNVLKNTGSSDVALAILDSTDAEVSLNSEQSTGALVNLPVTEGAVTLPYKVAYKSMVQPASAGSVAATTTYTIAYR